MMATVCSTLLQSCIVCHVCLRLPRAPTVLQSCMMHYLQQYYSCSAGKMKWHAGLMADAQAVMYRGQHRTVPLVEWILTEFLKIVLFMFTIQL